MMYGKKNTPQTLRQEKKITVWVDNQRIRSDATKLHAQNEFISVLLNYTCCEFLLLNVVVAHNGVEDIIK